MTAHELARLLLTMPDVEVGYRELLGGENEWEVVEDVTVEVANNRINLSTYKVT